MDLFRGVAIICVVLIHTTSWALNRLEPFEEAHFPVSLANRALQFAVPAFLFLTAVLHGRSAARGDFRVWPFYGSRLMQGVLPYVVWSGLYGLFAVWTGSRTLESRAEPERWRDWLLAGDAYYHLYFMVIVIQFYAVFPLVRPLFRRPSLPVVLLVLLAIQLGFYWLNRLYLLSPMIGTLLPSYALPMGLGLYVGATFSQWPAFWRRWRLAILACAAVGLAFYLPPAYLALIGVPVNTFAYAAALWVYTSAVALLLLGLCGALARLPRLLLSPLRVLGENSLQVFLIHPAVIVLAGREATARLDLGPSAVIVGALCLLVPLGLSLLVKGSALSKILFGR